MEAFRCPLVDRDLDDDDCLKSPDVNVDGGTRETTLCCGTKDDTNVSWDGQRVASIIIFAAILYLAMMMMMMLDVVGFWLCVCWFS